MNFGVPKQRRTTREEKYPNHAVMSMQTLKGEKKTRSFILSPMAVELLGLPETNAVIAFSFDDDGTINIMNGNNVNIPDEYTIRVTKSKPRKFSDKRTYEYVAKLLNLNTDLENDFDLLPLHNVDNIQVSTLLLRPADGITDEGQDVNIEDESIPFEGISETSNEVVEPLNN